MSMSWKRTLAGLAATVVLGTGLVGCSPSPTTIAVVGGETITQGHVNEAVDALKIITSRSPGSESLATPEFVIRYEIFHQLFESAAADLNIPVSDEDRLTMLDDQYGQGGLATDLWNDPQTRGAMTGILDFDIANSLIAVGAVNTEAFLDALASHAVQLNPRYGEWNYDSMDLTTSVGLGGPMAKAITFTVPQ